MDFPIITYSYELHDLRKRESAKKQLLDSKRPIPISILNRLKQDFTVEWTYNSNSIEGNTLTIAETKLILEDGITVGAERSLNIFISSIGGDYEDYLPTGVIAEDPEVKYGQGYLSLLARKGRIDAYKGDRVCLTTKSAVQAYQQTKLKLQWDQTSEDLKTSEVFFSVDMTSNDPFL